MTHFRHIPAIKTVMTPFPWSVQSTDTVASALEQMKTHGIRHLPVMKGHVLSAIAGNGRLLACPTGERTDTTMAQLSLPIPLVVDTEEALDNVLDAMGRRDVDAVVVTHKGHLAGIFTHHDACTWFARYLREQFRPMPGNDAA